MLYQNIICCGTLPKHNNVAITVVYTLKWLTEPKQQNTKKRSRTDETWGLKGSSNPVYRAPPTPVSDCRTQIRPTATP